MKNIIITIAVSSVLVFSICGSASALDLGTNITIPDLSSTGTGWYGSQEDNEVEPNCVTDQSWDLEGFFLEGTTLTMVGGYDFVNGEYRSGDIFIDVDGDAIYGSSAANLDGLTEDGNKNIPNNYNYGYDYVLDMDFAEKTYSVYQIGANTEVVSVLYRQNDGSNAWQFVLANDQPIQGQGNVPFSYFTGLGDSDVGGLSGSYHNAVSVDLDFLAHGTTFISHFTMGCGNDNLMGQGTLPAPEPASLLLLGVGLLGAGFVTRRKIKK